MKRAYKNTRRIDFVLTSFLCLLCSFPMMGQSYSRISGEVKSIETGQPVDFANIILYPSELFTLTDNDGKFSFKEVPAGKVTLSVQFFGMETIDTTFTVKPGERHYLKFQMKTTSFRLDNVVVTATQSKAGKSTASNISRQAMDHMQTSSLIDVMALVPGASVTNPDLSSAQNLTLRTLGTSSGNLAMNSLGTAVIVDGAPISNNANMQFLTSSQSGSTSDNSGGNSGVTGIDVRSLSTDNIESVEVIRGIPSVEYGDMTSGAVIVKSKAGKSPWTIRFKTNPNIYQASIAKGFSLGRKAGDLNISGDYAYNTASLTNALNFYQRANLKALWSVMFAGNSSENTSLSVSFGRDRNKLNPDQASQRTQSYANDIGFQFNTNGRATINKGWVKNVNWLLSMSYNHKRSHYESTATNAMNLYSTAMEGGLIYSNIAGLQVKDKDGQPITNIAEDNPIKGVILPYSYFYMYDIYGKELNVFAKLNADFGKTWDNISERIFVGLDFKTDGNLGQGPVYDDETPPWRNISNISSGYRRRPYYEIPFVNQLGVYIENYFNWRFYNREFNLSAGLRFDWVNGKTVFAPRINASLDIVPDIMTIRGGWGITAKAPTAIHLYPNKAYQDIVNYNGMSETIPENERLLIATTNVYDTTNPDLQIATNRKAEIGLDFTIAHKYRISLTGYDEFMGNGYNFGLGIDSFIWFENHQYKVAKENPGSIPTLEEKAVHHQFFEIYKPRNNVKTRNSGIEYEIDLGRFDAIRTSFYINGAWMRSSTTNAGYSFSTLTSNASERNIGIYNPEKTTSFVEKVNTMIKVTHNIPTIGLAITLTGQINWMTRFWDEFHNDDMFVKYISRHDGQVHDFDPSMKDDPEFSYLFPTLTENRFVVEQYFPTVLFNLNVSKEISDTFTASFYVNNLFNQRPLYKNKASGSMTELGIPMFFGFEFKVKIK